MSPVLVFVVGAGLGLVAARVLMDPSSCCNRVALGVRDRVGEELGGTAQGIGDFLGVWSYTPGLLDFFGVT